MNEDQPEGTVVGVVRAVDVDKDDRLVMSIGLRGKDSFSLGETTCGDDGGSTACSANPLSRRRFDHETVSELAVDVTVVDVSGLDAATSFIIKVVDVNEAPVIGELDNSEVPENTRAGSTVGFAKTSDVDIKEGSSAPDQVACRVEPEDARFFIENNLLKVGAGMLDFESSQSHSVRVVYSDDGVPSMTTARMFEITVRDVNEAPLAVILSKATVPENSEGGTVVGALSVVDEDANEVHHVAAAGLGSRSFCH